MTLKENMQVFLGDPKLDKFLAKRLARTGELNYQESIELLISLIGKGQEYADVADNGEIMIVIGNTGGGKSTVIYYIGC